MSSSTLGGHPPLRRICPTVADLEGAESGPFSFPKTFPDFFSLVVVTYRTKVIIRAHVRHTWQQKDTRGNKMSHLPTITEAVQIANAEMNQDGRIFSVEMNFQSLTGPMVAEVFRDGRLEVRKLEN